MNEPTQKESVIRLAFEAVLIDGLKPQPLVNRDGPVVDPVTQEVLTGPPDSAFLSVVRAYLKDIQPSSGDSKVPQTGQPRPGGLMDSFMQAKGKGLPFGRPQ